jgi:hypothetical protein
MPLPKPIRFMEEYGVPFIGWAYRMQMPLMRMAKENPTNVAGIVAAYYLLDNLSGGDEGYAGGVKVDSWFLHNVALDTNVLSMSPIMKGNVPDLKPQFMNEVIGVMKGDKSIFELGGLNIK